MIFNSNYDGNFGVAERITHYTFDLKRPIVENVFEWLKRARICVKHTM
jgi:hypothetical protein